MKQLLTLLLVFVATLGLFAQSTLLEEDFEAGIPDTWTAENNWISGNATSLSSEYFQYPAHTIFAGVNDDALGGGISGNGKLISPPLDLTAYESVFLNFEAYFINGDFGADERARVMVSLDGGTSWTTIYELGGVSSWQSLVLPIIGFGGEVIQVAFDYVDGGGWNFGIGIDDVKVVVPPSIEAGLTSIDIPKFQPVEDGAIIGGTIQNLGSETLNSVDVTWSVGDESYTTTLSGLNLGIAETADFNHEQLFSLPDYETYEVEVTLSNPNGGEDTDMTNNSLTGSISGVTYIPVKRVVIEEGTGTWCGWCPRGHLWMNRMAENYPETFIGVASHNRDPMAVTSYNNALGFGGYPSAHIDRFFLNEDPLDLEAFYLNRIEDIAPIDVIIDGNYDAENRTISFTVSAQFVTRLNNLDYRFSALILEDGVIGTGSGYNQRNYYSFQADNIPLSDNDFDWQAAPDPVPASDMVYKDVARALLTPINGVVNSVPSAVTEEDLISYTFQYVIPQAYDSDQISVLGLILDGTTGEILNGMERKISDFILVNSNEVFDQDLARIYPNPFQNRFYMELNLDEATNVQLEVYNSLGQQVGYNNYGQVVGRTNLHFDTQDLPAGMYTAFLRIGDKLTTKKITLAR